MVWRPHSDKQERALLSDKRFTVVSTGIQWGKSECGAIRMLRKCHEYTDPSDTFIITAPTFKIMEQATLPTFMEMVPQRFGQYKKADNVFKIRGGGTIYFRTGHIPDSVVGIRKCRHIWGDEAGLYSLYFWENLQGRAAPMQATIDLTTSPYSLNWVWKELIAPTQKGLRQDVELIQARSDENPYFPAEEYETRKKTMDPRRFRMMFGGEFGRPEGLVYDCYDEDANRITTDELPRDLRIFGGIDWGYTEPWALAVIGVDADGTHYLLHEIKRSRLAPSDIKDIVRQQQHVWQMEAFFAGPDQPGYIQELNTIPGVSVIGANNDISLGVGKVYSLIRQRKLKFLGGKCRHTLDELETYRYPDIMDDKPEKGRRDVNPIGKDDHSLDALRYGIVSIENYIKVKPPRRAGEAGQRQLSHRERLAAIMKPHQAGRTERWG